MLVPLTPSSQTPGHPHHFTNVAHEWSYIRHSKIHPDDLLFKLISVELAGYTLRVETTLYLNSPWRLCNKLVSSASQYKLVTFQNQSAIGTSASCHIGVQTFRIFPIRGSPIVQLPVRDNHRRVRKLQIELEIHNLYSIKRGQMVACLWYWSSSQMDQCDWAN